jgi:hypothetical protein
LDELQEELESPKIGTAIITETKKKLQGTCDLNTYTMIHGGVQRDRRASARIVILVNKYWTN